MLITLLRDIAAKHRELRREGLQPQDIKLIVYITHDCYYKILDEAHTSSDIYAHSLRQYPTVMGHPLFLVYSYADALHPDYKIIDESTRKP